MTKDTVYEIRVMGHLSRQWEGWFDDMHLENLPNGETVLYGPIPDQAALYGIVDQLRDLGLTLVSLRQVDTDHNHDPQE